MCQRSFIEEDLWSARVTTVDRLLRVLMPVANAGACVGLKAKSIVRLVLWDIGIK